MKKGISLPVNMIVILAIAAIVLLAVGAFFLSGWFGPGKTISDFEAWTRGCSIWMTKGCIEDQINSITIIGYDPDGNGSPNNLAEACFRHFGYTSSRDCWEKCCGPGRRG
ncbi:MAG: hypothetical protein QXQ40_00375 [Candidatus Aenigmatarchaeota archaeon]